MKHLRRKKVPLYTNTFISAFILQACGGGGSNGNSENSAVSGAVIKGPLENAFVFLDLDDDGQYSENEPSTRTLSDGSFSISSAITGVGFVAKTDASTIDTSSGEVLENITLKAPSGASVVTPTTTIMKEANLSASEVSRALGLPDTVDPLTFNPFDANADQEAALVVEKISQQIVTTIKTLGAAAEGAGLDAETAASLATQALVNTVRKAATSAEETVVNFANEADIADATANFLVVVEQSSATVDNESLAAVADIVQTSIKNVNETISNVTSLDDNESQATFAITNTLKDQIKQAVEDTASGNTVSVDFVDIDNLTQVIDQKVTEITDVTTQPETPTTGVGTTGGSGGGSDEASADTITDFTDGTDVLGLAGGLQYSQLTIDQGSGDYANDTLVSITSTSEYLAVLQGISASDITEEDFQPLLIA